MNNQDQAYARINQLIEQHEAAARDWFTENFASNRDGVVALREVLGSGDIELFRDFVAKAPQSYVRAIMNLGLLSVMKVSVSSYEFVCEITGESP